MNYFIDNERILFIGKNISGFFVLGTNSTYEIEYLAWVAEGNTAEEWQPESEGN